MEENGQPLAAQPAQAQTALKHLNAVPLIISTTLLALACILAPLALFVGMYNDTGDSLVTEVVSSVLVACFITILAHVIVGFLTLRDFKSIKLCAAAVRVNVAFLVSILLVPLTILLMTFMPSQGTGTSDTSAYLLLILTAMLAMTVVPALGITSLIMSVIIITKRKLITR